MVGIIARLLWMGRFPHLIACAYRIGTQYSVISAIRNTSMVNYVWAAPFGAMASSFPSFSLETRLNERPLGVKLIDSVIPLFTSRAGSDATRQGLEM
jgi:hypothetical protein